MSVGAIVNRPELLQHAPPAAAQETSDGRVTARLWTSPATRMSLRGAWSSYRARQLGRAASAASRSSDHQHPHVHRQSCMKPSRSRCAHAPPWSAQARRRPARPRAPRSGLELEAAHRGRPSSAAVHWAAAASIGSTRSRGRRQTKLRAGLEPTARSIGSSHRTARPSASCMAPWTRSCAASAPCDEAHVQSV